MKKLRLMTYNVHRCVGTDRALDVERVAEVIAAERPDVVALQELDVRRARTKGIDQAHRLAELLKMSFHFHPAMTVEKELYGDAILTALPERRIKAKGLPLYRRVPGLEPRGALWVEVDVAGPRSRSSTPIWASCRRSRSARPPPCWVLTGWAPTAGSRPASSWATSTPRPIRRPTGCCGPPCATPRRRAPAGNARRRRPFPPAFPFMRIDHVFLTKGLETRGVSSPYDGRARVASDHLPLVVELEITAEGAPAAAAAARSISGDRSRFRRARRPQGRQASSGEMASPRLQSAMNC
jgi:endonuclease/exonuclease/phosphatase family metal-dependent hydrolase